VHDDELNWSACRLPRDALEIMKRDRGIRTSVTIVCAHALKHLANSRCAIYVHPDANQIDKVSQHRAHTWEFDIAQSANRSEVR
jgi:hypothetical protein